jgi:Domain of unknown function (DUF1906)
MELPMKFSGAVVCGVVAALAGIFIFSAASKQNASLSTGYLGFDRNEYPGDEALAILRKTFSFSGYWLGAPPGGKQSSWSGKRALLEKNGFGFLVLFNGRETKTLKSAANGAAAGTADAQSAAGLAKQEGFPANTVVYLDIEEGGRLPDPYHAYLAAWFDELIRNGFRPGVYCSGMPVNEGHGVSITTVQDIQSHASGKSISYWIYNDACPPSPGCSHQKSQLSVSQSGFPAATVWQYAQSPRRKEFTAKCPSHYADDGNCYAANDTGRKWFLDLNVSSSPNPSAPR